MNGPTRFSIRLAIGLFAVNAGIRVVFAADLPVAQEVSDHATVAADGSADYKSVQEAINAAPQLTDPAKPWTISIKPGTYHELIYVMREKRFIRLIGEDPAKTIITGALNANQPGVDGLPMGTFRTPTVWIDADDFIVENLTIANAAGPVGQAVALRIDGDRVALRHCRLQGWQDTLLVNRGRHYFQDCEISGAIDFIFGGATALFDSCHIVCVGDGYITAASTLPYDAFGLVFLHCTITGSNPTVRTYLGRPWRAFASTTYVECTMSNVISPAGWNNWDRPEREKTTRYAEYNNYGSGASLSERVAWVKKFTAEEATQFTVNHVLGGNDHWSPDK